MFGKKTASLTEQDVLAALKGVKDPDIQRDLVDLGMIRDIRIGDNSVELTVNRVRISSKIPPPASSAVPPPRAPACWPKNAPRSMFSKPPSPACLVAHSVPSERGP